MKSRGFSRSNNTTTQNFNSTGPVPHIHGGVMNIQQIDPQIVTDLGSEPNLDEEYMNIFDDAPQN